VHRSSVVIVNPVSGGGRGVRRGAALLAGPYVGARQYTTTGPGDVRLRTREALEGGAGVVVAVGGDGTYSEALAGFLDEEGAVRFPDAELHLAAAGTGSDLCRSLPVARTVVADYGLARAGSQMIPFLNECSLGLAAAVLGQLRRASRVPRRLAYITASLRALPQARVLGLLARWDDASEESIDASLLVIANGRYFGAGMRVAPDAAMDDGYLDVLWTATTGSAALAAMLTALVAGAHPRRLGIHARRVRHIELRRADGAGSLGLESDGELRAATSLDVRVVSPGLRVRRVDP
jgi:diacylglycerol kinase family enzyme